MPQRKTADNRTCGVKNMKDDAAEIYTFGPFSLDVSKGLLLDQETPVHLPRTSFEVLKVLVAHSPEPVSTTEIAAAVWGEPETPQSKSHLRQAISTLRAAIGTAGRIEMLRDQGYRFLNSDKSSVNTTEKKPKRFTLVLTAEITEKDSKVLEALLKHLRKISGDASLSIKEVRQG